MIVRSLEQIAGTDREVQGPTWASRRFLLKSDQMGFSLHDTIIHAGTQTEMQYRNHLEAVYCIEGHGKVKLLATGEEFAIQAGTMYALDKNDHHLLIAESDMRMICVFNPPLVGPESHDETGAYPLLTS